MPTPNRHLTAVPGRPVRLASGRTIKATRLMNLTPAAPAGSPSAGPTTGPAVAGGAALGVKPHTSGPSGAFAPEGYATRNLGCEVFNSIGEDSAGFNRDGVDRDGFGRDGFNRSGFDRDGFDLDGLSCIKLDRDGNRADLAGPYGYDPVTGDFAVDVPNAASPEVQTTNMEGLWRAGWIIPNIPFPVDIHDDSYDNLQYIHRLTGTVFAPDGFDCYGVHSDTGTRVNLQGFDSWAPRTIAKNRKRGR